MKGNTFVRVDQPFYNSHINCYERNCERFTPYQYVGTEKFDDNWPDKRMLGDGEITQGCIDQDGHIFGKANSMLIPKDKAWNIGFFQWGNPSNMGVLVEEL